MYSNWVIRMSITGMLVALLSACSHAIPLNPTAAPSLATPVVEENVGVFFSEEFRTFEWRGSRYGDTWVFPLGPASVDVLSKTFDQVFNNADTVQSLPPLEDTSSDLSAVIEARIEEFDFHIPFLKTQVYTAQITYRFILHDATGEPIASWTITGEGAKSGQIGFEYAKWPGLAADAAMEDAAKKFSDRILNNPEIRRWLRERGKLIARIDPFSRQIKGPNT